MRKLPPLHALRAFEAAARHMHFANAAEELGLTPTAISHQVKLLEDLVGHKLFIRQPRPMRLTAQGERLFPVVRDSLDKMADAIDALGTAEEAEALRVSMNHSFAARWFLPRLKQAIDETGLDILIDADDAIVDLHARQVDCAVRYPVEIPKTLTTHRLFEDRMIAVGAPDLQHTYGEVSLPSDLLAYPLIHYPWKSQRQDAPSWARWVAEAEKTEQGIANLDIPKGLHISEEAHAIEAALAGQGVVLASDVEVAGDIRCGRLVQLSDVSLPGLSFYLVHLREHTRAGDMERLADWFRKTQDANAA